VQRLLAISTAFSPQLITISDAISVFSLIIIGYGVFDFSWWIGEPFNVSSL